MGSLSTFPVPLRSNGLTGSSLGGFATKYLTDPNRYVNSITITVDNPTTPSVINFNPSVVGGTIAMAYLSTWGIGVNVDPIEQSGTNVINLNFGSNSLFEEYINSNAIFFLTIKWA